MSLSPERLTADLPGAAALPRKNGELVFDELWEARVFGMALTLAAQHPDTWAELRGRLVAELGTAAGGATLPVPAPDYYERWLTLFEAILVEQRLLDRNEIDVRTAQFASGEREEVG